MQRYDRLGIVPAQALLDAVRANQNISRKDPRAKARMNLLGVAVGIDSLRLQTFAKAAVCQCSEPTCQIMARYVAIERHPPKAGSERKASYHANLYGFDADGTEVLFTHDHTLARGLGGADDIQNTTIMCEPCNQRKAKLEHKLIKEQRRQAGLDLHTGKPSKKEYAVNESNPSRTILKAERDFLILSQQHEGGVESYRAYCENKARTQNGRKNKNPSLPAIATALNMSVEAALVFQHERRNYHLQKFQANIQAPDALAHFRQTALNQGITENELRALVEEKLVRPRTEPVSDKHRNQADNLGLSAEGLDYFRKTYPARAVRAPRP